MGEIIGVPEHFKSFPPDSFPQVLWRAGFWDARVDSVRGDTMFISPGQAYIARKITVDAENTKIQALAQDNIIIHPGDTLTAELIARQENRFISLCEDNGFPFAYCEHSFRGRGNEVEIHFHIDPGELVQLARLEPEIEGKTRPAVIAHTMLFKPNQKFSRADILRATARLRRAGIVRIAGEPYPALAPDGKWVLVIKCRDIPSTSVSGTAGYSEDKISGGVEFVSKNLFGTGRKLNFSFNADDTRRDIELYYSEPYLFSSNISPEFSAKLQLLSEEYTRREYSFGITIPLGYETDIKFGITAGATIPETTGINRQENYGIYLKGVYSTLDDAVLPQKGIHITLGGSGEYQNVEEDTSSHQLGATGTASFLVALKSGKFSVWIEGSAWGWLAPKLVDRSRWEFLGGWKNLRGYRQNQFSGMRIITASLQPRFMPTGSVHLFPFVDLGAYRDEIGWNFKYSYGAGIEYRYHGGAFSIMYGIGEGRTIWNGLLHFGIRMNM